MKIIAVLLALSFVGCASVPTTRDNIKQRRVFIDESTDPDTTMLVKQALWQSGKWFVVDRDRGLNALKNEQERQGLSNEEKYAELGKLFGAGAVVIPSDRCVRMSGIISLPHYVCDQFLTVVDSSTGEVLVSVRNKAEGGSDELRPNWDETVEKMEKSFPKTWEPVDYGKHLLGERKRIKEAAEKVSAQ